MAREKMVTRTVIITKCKVMCVHVDANELTTDILKISGSYDMTDAKGAMKAIKQCHETDTYKPTHILEMEHEELLYGMPESKFIEMAEILPPRKVYGETENA